ncbi:MAG: hypothetical protein ABIS29_15890, partial [Vicinamibacterales bacterium]
MHSFARFCAGAVIALTAVDVCAQADPKVSPAPAPPAAGGSAVVPTSTSATGMRYEVLLEQELRVSNSPASSAEDFRVVVNRYWSFVRRYPTSGFADNALWQAANLSADAFQRFNQDRDNYRAVQLFQWLRDQYPHSPLQAKAAAQIAHVEATAPSPPQAAPAASDSTVRAVHREVLSDVVRVTVELDREVPFYQERLDGPARLF